MDTSERIKRQLKVVDEAINKQKNSLKKLQSKKMQLLDILDKWSMTESAKSVPVKSNMQRNRRINTVIDLILRVKRPVTMLEMCKELSAKEPHLEFTSSSFAGHLGKNAQSVLEWYWDKDPKFGRRKMYDLSSEYKYNNGLQ